MDKIDVKREANKRAAEVALSSGAPLSCIRTIEAASVKREYQLAVASECVPAGMLGAWRRGWKYGIDVAVCV